MNTQKKVVDGRMVIKASQAGTSLRTVIGIDTYLIRKACISGRIVTETRSALEPSGFGV